MRMSFILFGYILLTHFPNAAPAQIGQAPGLPSSGILFSESFDASTWPAAWERTGYKPGIFTLSNSPNAGGSPYEVDARRNSGTGTTRLITPAINTAGYDTVYLFFKYRYTDYGSGLTIRIQSSNDKLSWTDESWSKVSGTGNTDASVQMCMITHNLDSMTYLSFTLIGNHNSFSNLNIDNLILTDDIPSPVCSNYLEPADSAGNLNLSLTLRWSIADFATSYLLYAGTDNPPTNKLFGYNTGNQTYYNISNLTPGATYFWKVAAVNQKDTAGNCPVRSFTTFPPYTLPYFQDFQTSAFPAVAFGWTSESSASQVKWTTISGSIPGCPSSTMARLNCGNYQYAATARLISPPLLTTGIQHVKVSFRHKFTNHNGCWVRIQSSSDKVNWTNEGFSSNLTGDFSVCEEICCEVNHNLGDTTYICFFVDYTGFSLQEWLIDDVIIDVLPGAPECISSPVYPADTQTMIPVLSPPRLSWKHGYCASEYLLYFGTDNPPTNMINGLALGYNVSCQMAQNLDSNTVYYWQVVPVNAVDTADMCPVWSFRTVRALSLPYTQYFASSKLPPGFLYQGPQNETYWKSSNTANAGSNPYELNGWGAPWSRCVLPPLNTENLDSLNISFRYKVNTPNATTLLRFQTSTDGINWTDEPYLLSVPGLSTASGIVNAPIYSNLGAKVYIAIYTQASSVSSKDWWFIDNLVIRDPASAPPCIPVLEPGLTDSVSPPLLMKWEQSGFVNNYILTLGTADNPVPEIDGMSLGNVNQYTASQLQYGKLYYWYLKICYAPSDTFQCDTSWFQVIQDPLQQLPYNQSFEDAIIPYPWKISPQASPHIIISNTNYAHGTPYEFGMLIPNLTSANVTYRMISPPVNTAGLNKVWIHFRQGLRQRFSTSGNVFKIQTGTDGINFPDDIWVTNGNSSFVNPVSIAVNKSFTDRTYFSWMYTGNISNMEYWMIDSVVIKEAKAHDAGVIRTDFGTTCQAGEASLPKATVMNYGMNPATFDVSLTISDGYQCTRQVQNLQPDASAEIIFDPWIPVKGTYTATAVSHLPSDGDPTNDTSTNSKVTVVSGTWSAMPVPFSGYLGSSATLTLDDTSRNIYACGGNNNLLYIRKYGTVTGQWEVFDTLPFERVAPASAIINGTLYLAGGAKQSGMRFAAVTKHDLTTGTITYADSLPFPVSFARAAAFQDSLMYLVGGMIQGNVVINSVFLYNRHTNKWRECTSLPDKRHSGAMIINGNKIYYLGGETSNVMYSGTRTLFIGTIDSTDHAVITWTSGPDYPPGTKGYFEAAPWGEDGFIAAAGIPNTDVCHCYSFDFSTGEYQMHAKLPVKVYGSYMGSARTRIFPNGDEEWKLFVISGMAPGGLYPSMQVLTDRMIADTAPPKQYQLPDSLFICQGNQGANMTLDSCQSEAFYQLFKNGDPFGLALNGMNAPLTWTGLEEGSYTMEATNYYTGSSSWMTGTTQVSLSINPEVYAGPDTSTYPNVGIQLNSTVTGGFPPYSCYWSPAAGLSDPFISNPIATNDTTTTYTIMVTDAHLCSDQDTITITITPAYGTVSGAVIYDNLSQDGLAACTVYLLSGPDTLYQTLTDSTGHYQFSETGPGSYTITASCNLAWGGGNAVDALGIMNHFAGNILLEGIRLEAADVNHSGYVNAVDALNTMKRFVGLISSFELGDWIFEKHDFTLNPPENISVQVKGLCTGDVNGSYQP